MRGIPADFDFQRNYCTMVGHLVVGFGQMDFGLDMLVGLLFRDFGGASKRWKNIPVPFEKRIEFITECAEILAPVRPHRAQLLRLVRQAKVVADLRNDVVHGYAGSYRNSDHMFTFVKAAVDKKRREFQVVKIRDVTATQLMKTGAMAIDLAAQISTLNLRLANSLGGSVK